LGKKIAEKGLDVYAMDILGHGRSRGPRGDPSFDDCLVSVNEILNVIKSKKETGRKMTTQDSNENSQNNIKIFILGHSLGCTFTLWYIHNFKKNCVNGVILMAPYFRISNVKKRSEVEPGTLYFLYLFLRRYLTPLTNKEEFDVVVSGISHKSILVSVSIDGLTQKFTIHGNPRYISAPTVQTIVFKFARNLGATPPTALPIKIGDIWTACISLAKDTHQSSCTSLPVTSLTQPERQGLDARYLPGHKSGVRPAALAPLG